MSDEAVMEIRRIRHQISEECGHDVDKVIAYYREIERELRESGVFRFEETGNDEVAHVQSPEISEYDRPLTSG